MKEKERLIGNQVKFIFWQIGQNCGMRRFNYLLPPGDFYFSFFGLQAVLVIGDFF